MVGAPGHASFQVLVWAGLLRRLLVIFRSADRLPDQVGGTMFPFWEIGVGKMAELDSVKLVAKNGDFSRSAVSFRPGNSRFSGFPELTSGGWNSQLFKS